MKLLKAMARAGTHGTQGTLKKTSAPSPSDVATPQAPSAAPTRWRRPATRPSDVSASRRAKAAAAAAPHAPALWAERMAAAPVEEATRPRLPARLPAAQDDEAAAHQVEGDENPPGDGVGERGERQQAAAQDQETAGGVDCEARIPAAVHIQESRGHQAVLCQCVEDARLCHEAHVGHHEENQELPKAHSMRKGRPAPLPEGYLETSALVDLGVGREADQAQRAQDRQQRREQDRSKHRPRYRLLGRDRLSCEAANFVIPEEAKEGRHGPGKDAAKPALGRHKGRKVGGLKFGQGNDGHGQNQYHGQGGHTPREELAHSATGRNHHRHQRQEQQRRRRQGHWAELDGQVIGQAWRPEAPDERNELLAPVRGHCSAAAEIPYSRVMHAAATMAKTSPSTLYAKA
eukprot:CAMPEP_0175604040 /NCGR_PEP_ID=MMETSP0096-20121207/59462_1 /TAXON_ID=311494 /ORGANISM="Alexandrium monilatum, Strain CCMP3105" /LENGTH=402 /DNA_ID=CAMNT_0016908761 /DNA_START=205 /DNA_END=1413 /DNA_ORIENTATION=+